MVNAADNKQPPADTGIWLKKWLLPSLIFLVIIAISISIVIYLRDPQKVTELKNYGYLGAFLISLVGNASVLLPITVLPVLCAISIVLYPVTGPIGPIIIGILGGAGAGIGEITSYMVGYTGRRIVSRHRWYLSVVRWMKRWGGLAIFINALLPFFFDLAGIAAGAMRFPVWKFIIACWLGRTINYVGFNLLVAVWGHQIVLRYLG